MNRKTSKMKRSNSKSSKYLKSKSKKLTIKNSSNFMDLRFCSKKYGTAVRFLLDITVSLIFCFFMKLLSEPYPMTISFLRKTLLYSTLRRVSKKWSPKNFNVELSMIQNLFQTIWIFSSIFSMTVHLWSQFTHTF